MCTLVVAARVVPGHPLVVVANRDELRARPSTGPRLWPAVPGRARFVAPRDEVAGGTWLGWNEHGVFVGITNRFLGPRDATRKSRGDLVVDALGEPSAAAIHARMAQIDPAAYNGFHLLYADARDVLVTVSDGAILAQLALGDGLAIVTERTFAGGADAGRTQRIREGWSRFMACHTSSSTPERSTKTKAELFVPPRSVACHTSPSSSAVMGLARPLAATLAGSVAYQRPEEAGHDAASATAALGRLLTAHDPDPSSATCIHLDELGYGTRSALVLDVAGGAPPGMATLLWAEGPPCVTPFHTIEAAF